MAVPFAHQPVPAPRDARQATTAPGEPAPPSEPAYRTLAIELRQAILAGEYPPERRLPTEAELAAARGLGRQTVRQAFAQLVAEGLVYRVRGRGSFATPFSGRQAYLRSFGSVGELLALSIDTELEIVRPLERRADVDAAGRLLLASDQLMSATFRRLHDDIVFCVTTTSLPLEVGRRLAQADFLLAPGARSPETIIGLIERVAGIPIAGADQSITAVSASPEVASAIECEPGQPVLRIDRVYFGRDGERVELAVTHCNPDRYSYRLELRRNVD